MTRLLLLGLFYTIQMQIYVLFCTRLYQGVFEQKIHPPGLLIFQKNSNLNLHV
jgi:hypothetical protein